MIIYTKPIVKAIGKTGPTGKTGVTGPPGKTGNQGTSGRTGKTGAQGPRTGQTGVRGRDGFTGRTGMTGMPGLDGIDGKTGVTGNVNLEPWFLFTNHQAQGIVSRFIAGKTASPGDVMGISSDSRLLPPQIGYTLNWEMISTGENHSLGIKNGGELWAWGANSNGQLGDGTIIQKILPTRIGTDSDWEMISAGGNHSLAIKNGGELWAWGANSNGQLGDGTVIDKHEPVRIGSASDWSVISAGVIHSMGIKTAGQLWSWGSNANGRTGLGTTTGNTTSPTRIGSASDWITVTAGAAHTIGMKNLGEIWGWGYNDVGSVGDGTTTQRTSPVRIGSASDWEKISSGFYHTIAIKNTGELWGWGYNNVGQLGVTNTGSSLSELRRTSPIRIGTASNWDIISSGANHSLVINDSGELWACGSNGSGQLGDGTQTTSFALLRIGSATDWEDISGGLAHTLGMKNIDELWAWGQNNQGQLGKGNTLNPQIFLARADPYIIGINAKLVLAIENVQKDDWGNFLEYGYFRNDFWTFTRADPLFVDLITPGAITNIKPSNNIRILGYAYGTSIIFFNPSKEVKSE